VWRKTKAVVAAGIVASVSFLGPVSPANADVVTCGVARQYPHASTHVNGTINTISTVQCDGVTASIYLRVTIEKKSNGNSWQGAPTANVLSTYAWANVVIPCSKGPGKFRNVTYVNVVGTPSAPGDFTSWYYGPWVSVACGVSAASLPDGSEAPDPVQVGTQPPSLDD
jgi:hypothetical protein